MNAATLDRLVRTNIPWRMWDVSADGERFLVNRLLVTSEVVPLRLVQNWTSEVQR